MFTLEATKSLRVLKFSSKLEVFQFHDNVKSEIYLLVLEIEYHWGLRFKTIEKYYNYTWSLTELNREDNNFTKDKINERRNM